MFFSVYRDLAKLLTFLLEVLWGYSRLCPHYGALQNSRNVAVRISDPSFEFENFLKSNVFNHPKVMYLFGYHKKLLRFRFGA
jgi:hypothetical protein